MVEVGGLSAGGEEGEVRGRVDVCVDVDCGGHSEGEGVGVG